MCKIPATDIFAVFYIRDFIVLTNVAENIVAAFWGMHVSPVKRRYANYQGSVTTGQTDAGQSDPYVPLCFAGDTIKSSRIKDTL